MAGECGRSRERGAGRVGWLLVWAVAAAVLGGFEAPELGEHWVAGALRFSVRLTCGSGWAGNGLRDWARIDFVPITRRDGNQ